MSLLQIPKRKRRPSQQGKAFAEQFATTEETATTKDASAALRKKLETDTRPIEAPTEDVVAVPAGEAPEKPEKTSETLHKASQAETVQEDASNVPAVASTGPTHPAYKGERERVTGRFRADLVARLDAIGLLEIEDRNSIIERVLEAWVKAEWGRLETRKGKADVEFAYGRARAALEKKRNRQETR